MTWNWELMPDLMILSDRMTDGVVSINKHLTDLTDFDFHHTPKMGYTGVTHFLKSALLGLDLDLQSLSCL